MDRMGDRGDGMEKWGYVGVDGTHAADSGARITPKPSGHYVERECMGGCGRRVPAILHPTDDCSNPFLCRASHPHDSGDPVTPSSMSPDTVPGGYVAVVYELDMWAKPGVVERSNLIPQVRRALAKDSGGGRYVALIAVQVDDPDDIHFWVAKRERTPPKE